ncbi:MAG: alkanal monooxygenase, partial [Acidimicrobiales bacterium]
HFMPANTLPAIELYRSRFRPSEVLDQPYVMVGVAAICADDAAHARWLHSSMRLSMLRLRTGRPGPLPDPDEASRYPFTPAELEVVSASTGSHVVGDPGGVAAGLDELAASTGADELMITTNVFDPAERVRSYELVAEVLGARRGAAA